MPLDGSTRAVFRPSTFDAAARTVRATVATANPVPRRDQRGPFFEILDLDAVNPAALIGLNVIDGHRTGSVENVIGVVTNAGRDTAGLWAEIRFSTRRDEVMQDVRDGVLTGISIGYSVDAVREGRDGQGARTVTVTAWTPHEISFTPIPADRAATVRNANMPDTNPAPAADPQPGNRTQQASDTQARAAVNQEIRSIARTTGMDRDWADGQIDAGASADEARRAAIEAMERRTTPIDTTSRVAVGADHNDPVAVREAMAGALASRMLGTAPEGRAQEFRPWSVTAMAGHLMVQRGVRIDPNNRNAVVDALFRRDGAHTTSDFPLLLEAAANKVLLDRYQAAAPTYRMWAAQRDFNDFKPAKFLRLGDFPAFAETEEEGETAFGTMSENRESVTAGEFTSGIKISRKAMINDDLGALGDFGALIATRAAQHENTLAYTLIASDGPTLSDAAKMFTTGRGNKASSASTVDITNVALAVKAMRGFTTADGVLLNIAPKYLVVGPAKEVVARQLLATITPTKASDVNPFSGAYELVVDANIAGNAWFLMADPAMVPSVVFGYVAGATGPQIRTEIDFDTRKLVVAAGLDFGVGAIDWRGAYYNAGA
ncbi:MAG: Mu-like prophage major head subunit gpT family protein [Rhodospirillaceae bacterium]|nr:Mu-like prophage major head subunit gpT family protein [Rhodospirillaceae bacterium]